MSDTTRCTVDRSRAEISTEMAKARLADARRQGPRTHAGSIGLSVADLAAVMPTSLTRTGPDRREPTSHDGLGTSTVPLTYAASPRRLSLLGGSSSTSKPSAAAT